MRTHKFEPTTPEEIDDEGDEPESPAGGAAVISRAFAEDIGDCDLLALLIGYDRPFKSTKNGLTSEN